MSGYDIRTVDLGAIVEFRTALLDPSGTGLADPRPGDEHPAARHVAAFFDGVVVGSSSIHPQGMPGGFQMDAWRLAGVAVEYGHRGAGLGALLVERCLEHAAESGAKAVWCQVPAGTYGFFQRLGFGRSGDPVDDPQQGPQYLLVREVRPLRRSWALQDA